MRVFFFYILFSTFVFSQNKELQPIESKEECIGIVDRVTTINQRIISSKTSNDTLSLEIKYIENCGNGKIINYTIVKDTIYFNFRLENFELADCDCFFTNKLKLKNPKIKNPIYKLNNTMGIKTIVLSDDYYEPKKYVSKEKDSVLVTDGNGFLYIRTYYKSGKLATLWIRKGNYSEKIKYYEIGRIQSMIQMFSSFQGYSKREWDIDGNLILYDNKTVIDLIELTQEQKDNGAISILSEDKNIKNQNKPI